MDNKLIQICISIKIIQTWKMEYMLNSTPLRVGFSKIRARITPGTVGNFRSLAET
jgi:hypothetical protein